MLIEVCAASLYSIKVAAQAKADRIELCAALEVGGLTPSAGFITEALKIDLLPIHCLIRPRQGHFCYNAEEQKLIEANIEIAKNLGCHGVIVGAHTKDFNLDLTILKKWKSLAGSMKITFHRAFDVLCKPEEALVQLIDIGFDCVLTAGGQEKAIAGLHKLEHWNTNYGSQIMIMPGSGIGVSNCTKFKQAGFKALHLSGGKSLAQIEIPSTINKELSFLNQTLKESYLKTLQEVVKLCKVN